jgi:hypothetical protein
MLYQQDMAAVNIGGSGQPLHFKVCGIGRYPVFNQPQPFRHAVHVCIDGESGHAQCKKQHATGRFHTDARQPQQPFPGGFDLIPGQKTKVKAGGFLLQGRQRILDIPGFNNGQSSGAYGIGYFRGSADATSYPIP